MGHQSPSSSQNRVTFRGQGTEHFSQAMFSRTLQVHLHSHTKVRYERDKCPFVVAHVRGVRLSTQVALTLTKVHNTLFVQNVPD